jgi:Kef-type K+ transport system membrane component KefB
MLPCSFSQQKIGGTLLTKLRQPSLIGELLAGTVLGSILISFGGSPTIQVVAQLGIIFLILLTMLSIDLNEIEQDIERFSRTQRVWFSSQLLMASLSKSIRLESRCSGTQTRMNS